MKELEAREEEKSNLIFCLFIYLLIYLWLKKLRIVIYGAKFI